jgi:S-adenosyl-L-methionine hydrolase (adenosine-forming)
LSFLTLTTDFGTKDGFVGTMKGVIWKICPQVQIADISHEISPQNILEGAIALWRAYPFFPDGTVHVIVVDPGVGTARRPIAARLGTQYFVGPDNGILTPIIEDAEAKGGPVGFVHLTNPTYWLPDVSHTFHGRDIFSPVGAWLANGADFHDLGPAITDVVRKPLPRPEKTATGWTAQISVVDAFGNCTTNLPASAVRGIADIEFHAGGAVVRGLVESYGHRKPGDLVALVDSESFVEIAVVNGSAAKKLGLRVGDPVEVVFKQ